MTFYEEIAKLKTLIRKGWTVRGVGQKCRREDKADIMNLKAMIYN